VYLLVHGPLLLISFLHLEAVDERFDSDALRMESGKMLNVPTDGCICTSGRKHCQNYVTVTRQFQIRLKIKVCRHIDTGS